MVRIEIGNTTVRLFSNVEEASVHAKNRAQKLGEGWTVRQIDFGCFIHKGDQYIDTDGEFGKYLNQKQKVNILNASTPKAKF